MTAPGKKAVLGRTSVCPTIATRDLVDLKTRIIATVKNVDTSILTRVWQELKYRIDVCRVTRGAHIEHI
jgi:hypothetical protein